MLPVTVNPNRAEQAAEAFRMRSHGHADGYIATALNIPIPQVDRLIRRHVRLTKKLESDQERRAQRAIGMERLEELYRAQRERALDGDPKSVKAVLEILAAQRALLGTEAPKESVVTSNGGGEFLAFVRALKASKTQAIEATVVNSDS